MKYLFLIFIFLFPEKFSHNVEDLKEKEYKKLMIQEINFKEDFVYIDNLNSNKKNYYIINNEIYYSENYFLKDNKLVGLTYRF